ncbi:MAG: methyltransferase domain-containing protein [Gammaproteobacteria bacterium]
MKEFFRKLQNINYLPKPYESYTTLSLWNDPYISKKMLEAHLNDKNDIASRNKIMLNKTVEFIARRFGINEGIDICDFGCGPGLYTSQFAELGANVTGVDVSKRSIEYAKKIAEEKNLKITYVLQNYLEFEGDKHFDLVSMIYCDFCVLSPDQRKNLLNKFYRLLTDNGSIILDVYSINHFNTIKEEHNYQQSSNIIDYWSNFWSDQPYYIFNNTFKYEKEKLLLHKHTIIEEKRTREILNWLQCYTIQSLQDELRQNGFNMIEYYSDMTGEPYRIDSTEIAIVAQKIK